MHVTRVELENIKSFERGLEYICSHAGVWKATGSEVTAEFLKQVKA